MNQKFIITFVISLWSCFADGMMLNATDSCVEFDMEGHYFDCHYKSNYRTLSPQELARLAQQNDPEASFCYGVVLCKSGQKPQGLSHIRKAASLGHPQANYIYSKSSNCKDTSRYINEATKLGYAVHERDLIERSTNPADLRDRASKGDINAAYILGSDYFDREQYSLGIPYLVDAAERGHEWACYRLGTFYSDDLFDAKSPKNESRIPNWKNRHKVAEQYLLRVKGSLLLPSQFRLANIYLTGSHGIQKDINRAIHFLETVIADKHDRKFHHKINNKIDSLILLAEIYAYGRYNVIRNIPKAAEYLRKATFLGSRKPQEILINNQELKNFYSKKYDEMDGHFINAVQLFANDLPSAQREYSVAGELGHPIARHMMGLFHRSGNGVEKNANLALNWFLGAAYAGNADSQYMVGYLYNNEKKDTINGLNWYTTAASNGSVDAMLALGSLYRQQDVKKSIDYYWEALEYDSPFALEELVNFYKSGAFSEADVKERLYQPHYRLSSGREFERKKRYCEAFFGAYDYADEAAYISDRAKIRVPINLQDETSASGQATREEKGKEKTSEPVTSDNPHTRKRKAGSEKGTEKETPKKAKFYTFIDDSTGVYKSADNAAHNKPQKEEPPVLDRSNEIADGILEGLMFTFGFDRFGNFSEASINLEVARQWFKHVCEISKYPFASYLSSLLSGECVGGAEHLPTTYSLHKAGLDTLLKEGSECTKCDSLISVYYALGFIVSRDPKRAFEHAQKAYDAGDEFGKCALAACHRFGINVPEDQEMCAAIVSDVDKTILRIYQQIALWIKKAHEETQSNHRPQEEIIISASEKTAYQQLMLGLFGMFGCDQDLTNNVDLSQAWQCFVESNVSHASVLASYFLSFINCEQKADNTFDYSLTSSADRHRYGVNYWLDGSHQSKISYDWLLAIYYTLGFILEKDHKLAHSLAKAASDSNAMFGKHALSLCYKYGTGVKKDTEKAQALLEDATPVTVRLYDNVVAWMQESSTRSAISGKIVASEDSEYGQSLNNAYQQMLLGLYYVFGQDSDISDQVIDYQKARSSFANSNKYYENVLSTFFLMFFPSNYDVPAFSISPDHEDAVKFLSSKGGITNASHALLSLYYSVGLHLPNDPRRAFAFAQSARESNDLFGRYALARCYQEGIGVEKDLNKAEELLSGSDPIVMGLFNKISSWIQNAGKKDSNEVEHESYMSSITSLSPVSDGTVPNSPIRPGMLEELYGEGEYTGEEDAASLEEALKGLYDL